MSVKDPSHGAAERKELDMKRTQSSGSGGFSGFKPHLCAGRRLG
jgi:hypothetical protein